ncbi:sporulation integral membrane protein YtvI [Desulfotomaculum arcticum]|uniref:Sporulation integral membrane protein YtvI n=1 Tax=Desulfotruncus arcticus DSM 17038 TaxID=1121424 RepID=A0A1I2SI46_9FIRM|nr:sporulation integral membrane protein YtvI [Desulfotruncus arcticus]SFG49876.1 sporulation integral membrane protein YtvI [Desulfotomaculum arcticum] [Desulfotruncus arcticus DSM 17038]
MPRTIKNILYVLAAAVTILAGYCVIKYVLPEALTWLKFIILVLFPFLLAAIFSMLMEPLVEIVSRGGRIPRLLSVPIAMLLFFGGIGTVLTFFVLRLVQELNDLSLVLPDKLETIENFTDLWFKKGVLFYGTLPKSVTSNMRDTIEKLTNSLQQWISDLIAVLIHLISVVPGAIMVLLISIIATYFFSKDRDKIVEFWLRIIPHPWGERTLQISRQVAGAFQAYVRAQFILISITTVISIVGLYLIGTEYALTLGLLVGIFDMIPVLGPGTIYIPWAIWAFVTGNVVLGLKLTALYLLVMVVRAVMEAKVVAANLGLHPLVVLLAMYIGLKMIGVMGLVLGPLIVIGVQATITALSAEK